MALTDDKKAAIIAAVRAGGSVSSVARELGVGKATVSRIKNELPATELEQIGTVKQNNLEALIARYLEANLTTLITHAEMARDPNWFKKQNASDIAVFDGVMSDKTIRILEAAAAAQSVEGEVL